MGNNASTSKTNYAGIAAVITAVGGILGLFWQQNARQGQSDHVAASILAVLQYRIGELERTCVRHDPDRVSFPIESSRAPAAIPEPVAMGGGVAPVAAVVAVEHGEVGEVEAARGMRRMSRKIRLGEPIVLGDIKEYVQHAQRPISVEGFEP